MHRTFLATYSAVCRWKRAARDISRGMGITYYMDHSACSHARAELEKGKLCDFDCGDEFEKSSSVIVMLR